MSLSNFIARSGFRLTALAIAAIGLAACREPSPFPESAMDNRLSGGARTVFDNTSKAYGHEFPGLGGEDLRVHHQGDTQFEQIFVTAPAPVNSGLGPAYNNVSCISCHHNDGVGVPTTGGAESSLLLRISRPGTDEHGGPAPVPGFGGQIQDKAVFGKSPEARTTIEYSFLEIPLSGGETVTLRQPDYHVAAAAIPGDAMFSPRLAPPVFGLGLLESVLESDILANADPSDVNGDGIRGKPNRVWDPLAGATRLGRFGWKANTASILLQVAGAYNQDMGITTSVFPAEATLGQPQYDGKADDPELADSMLNAVAFYVRTLAVPARRNTGSGDVILGEQTFSRIGCGSCHRQTFTTGTSVAFPLLSRQVIHPYSDLLLHDMGAGLADNRPDFEATGTEWRTAPLWGIGLREIVNYPPYFLHDGRARTLAEAILWHGGEAESAMTRFKNLTPKERSELLKFLQSL